MLFAFDLTQEDCRSSAVFSDDEKYRWILKRYWGPGNRYLLMLMLNPSKAGAVESDPTVSRQITRAKMLGFDGLLVANVFAWVSTDPGQLRLVDDPVGSENDAYILAAARESAMIICAWGCNGNLGDRATKVLKLLAGFELYYLKMTNGNPWHPLYISYSQVPIKWEHQ